MTKPTALRQTHLTKEDTELVSFYLSELFDHYTDCNIGNEGLYNREQDDIRDLLSKLDGSSDNG